MTALATAVIAGWGLWVILAVAVIRRTRHRLQVRRWRTAWRQAQGRAPIVLSSHHQDPPYPFPTDPDTWNMLLSSEERVKWFFSPESIRRGLTKQFLDAYSKQYLAGHYPSDRRQAADASATNCPAEHRNAVPVEDLLGEVVAWLCPDCDRQLAEKPPLAPPPLPPFTPDPRLTRKAWM